MFKYIFILLTCGLSWYVCYGQKQNRPLHIIEDTVKFTYGYANAKGDTTIPLGKYKYCFTDKFYNFAIVRTTDFRTVGIDRNENILFDVFMFDNGPDYPSDKLFRIIINGKIGYADLKGHIVITPQFDCALPFEKGKAKVGTGCTIKREGEHSAWVGGTWHIIDKKGNTVGE